MVPAAAAASPAAQIKQLKAQLKRERASSIRWQNKLLDERFRTDQLREALKTTRQQVTDITGQRDALQARVTTLEADNQRIPWIEAQFEAARNNVPALIATMTVNQAFDLLDDIYARFPRTGLTWSSSVYRSGGYVSYDFTYNP